EPLGRTCEPQARASRVSCGWADDPAEEAEALRSRRKAVGNAECGEPGVGTGFSARCGGVRTGDPSAECGGCIYAGVFGFGSGYEFCQPESDASIGCGRGGARAAHGDPLRQRAGTDEAAFSGVVCGAADRVAAHSTGEADAERAHRELPRT